MGTHEDRLGTFCGYPLKSSWHMLWVLMWIVLAYAVATRENRLAICNGYPLESFWHMCWVTVRIVLTNVRAQSDARPTGDREVTGSIPAESAHIILWRFCEVFSTVIVSFPLV